MTAHSAISIHQPPPPPPHHHQTTTSRFHLKKYSLSFYGLCFLSLSLSLFNSYLNNNTSITNTNTTPQPYHPTNSQITSNHPVLHLIDRLLSHPNPSTPHPFHYLIKRSIDSHHHQHDESPSEIPYLQLYSTLPNSLKPFGLFLLVFWLLFLFAFVGIVASDFFCPNLSTISSTLGLSESVAGVTFLGLGNGAPDVFSTFAAMKAGSGSLAIGELVGAASFIVSVVAGSMTIVRPFRVPRHSFLRDVGFFTFAIAFILYIIHDGQIVRWEASALIFLYLAYVLVVALGSWYLDRKHRRRELVRKVRSEYAEDGQEIQPYRDDPDFPIQPDLESERPHPFSTPSASPHLHASYGLVPSPHESPRLCSPRLDGYHDSVSVNSNESGNNILQPTYDANLPTRSRRMRAPSLSYKPSLTPSNFITQTLSPVFGFSRASNASLDTRLTDVDLAEGCSSPQLRRRSKPSVPHVPKTAIRPSILGAIEFRDVVNSLTRDSRTQSFALYSSGRPEFTRPRLSASSGPPRPSVSDPNLLFNRRRAGSHSCTFPASQDRFITGQLSPISPLSSPPWLGNKPSLDSTPGRRTAAYGRRAGHRPSHSAAAGRNPDWTDNQLAHPPHEELDLLTNEEVHDTLSHESDRSSFPQPGDCGSEERNDAKLSSTLHDSRPCSSTDSWDARPADPIPNRNSRLFSQPPKLSDLSEMTVEDDEVGLVAPRPPHGIPSIMIIGAQGDALHLTPDSSPDCLRSGTTSSPFSARFAAPRRYWWWSAKLVLKVICPTLQDWRTKSYAGRFVALVSAPAILLLTLTLPVVDNDYEDYDVEEIDDELCEDAAEEDRLDMVIEQDEEPDEPDADLGEGVESLVMETNPLIKAGDRYGLRFAEGTTTGSERLHHDREKADETGAEGLPSDEAIAHWLAMLQCVLALPFSVFALSEGKTKWYLWVAAVLGGLSLATCVGREGSRRADSRAKLLLCFLGFFIAMVWILTIVNEVVGVLEALGAVMGVSDAILGLTIFAMGNSLGDLVANVTVARMGFPVMAMAACFGGPMLNVLLGIGLSSTYMISRQGGNPYVFETTETLLVSTIGLLMVLMVTLIAVPMNGFMLSRTWGMCLIGAYLIVLVVNVGVEVMGSRSR